MFSIPKNNLENFENIHFDVNKCQFFDKNIFESIRDNCGSEKCNCL